MLKGMLGARNMGTRLRKKLLKITLLGTMVLQKLYCLIFWVKDKGIIFMIHQEPFKKYLLFKSRIMGICK